MSVSHNLTIFTTLHKQCSRTLVPTSVELWKKKVPGQWVWNLEWNWAWHAWKWKKYRKEAINPPVVELLQKEHKLWYSGKIKCGGSQILTLTLEIDIYTLVFSSYSIKKSKNKHHTFFLPLYHHLEFLGYLRNFDQSRDIVVNQYTTWHQMAVHISK